MNTLLALSTPQPSIQFVGDGERFKYAEGINKVIDQGKTELISFSDSSGIIMIITVDSVTLEPNESEEVGRVFHKEVDRRRELDAWNKMYKEEFGSRVNKINDRPTTSELPVPTSVQIEDGRPPLKSERIQIRIYDEIFK